MTTMLVYLTLAVINFLGSIIQGVAGIGDAILLQVLWLMCCEMAPDHFKATPLGPEPVAAVTLLMYVRLLLMAPLVVYLGLSDSIFSKMMVIMMAIPSTIFSIIGVILFKMLDGKEEILKMVLGISSFFFALMYGCIICVRLLKKKRSVQALQDRNVKLTVEADAIKEEAKMSRDQSFTNLQASFVQNVPNTSILIMQRPHTTLTNSSIVVTNFMGSAGSPLSAAAARSVVTTLSQQPPLPPPVIDTATGLPVGTQEAFVSTITGEPFVASEAAQPQPTEDNVPPLSPSKLSPSRTMTYTRVRINRNLDENGKIKLTTKIGAAIAASLAGLMASLTGVNAPPQIIFILLFDAPNYIVRVNFSAQSIPSGILRFGMAIFYEKFKASQIPLFFVAVIFGYAGVFVGNSIGRLLGPTSFNIFVLCLLLLSSLAMVTKTVALLVFSTVLTFAVTAAVAYWEHNKNRPVITAQHMAEMEIEKRMYDVMEELQRSSNNSFIPPSQANSAASVPLRDIYTWRQNLINTLNHMHSPTTAGVEPSVPFTDNDDACNNSHSQHNAASSSSNNNNNHNNTNIVDEALPDTDIHQQEEDCEAPLPIRKRAHFSKAKDVVISDGTEDYNDNNNNINDSTPAEVQPETEDVRNNKLSDSSEECPADPSLPTVINRPHSTPESASDANKTMTASDWEDLR